MKLTGELPLGTTATDLVLTRHPDAPEEGRGGQVRRVLRAGPARARARRPGHHRQHGAGVRRHDGLLPGGRRDRCATSSARAAAHAVAERVERYCKEQGLFRTDDTPDPEFTSTLELDLGTVAPSLAGPKRPQDLVPLTELKRNFVVNLPGLMSAGVPAGAAGAGAERLLALGERGRRQRHHRRCTAPTRRRPPSRLPTPTPRRSCRAARRRRHRAARRRRGHRRDHQLHQHLEPVGHDRRRAAGQEGGGARAHDQALGQDQPGARARGS